LISSGLAAPKNFGCLWHVTGLDWYRATIRQRKFCHVGAYACTFRRSAVRRGDRCHHRPYRGLIQPGSRRREDGAGTDAAAGRRSIANAVLRGLIGSPFRDMAMYSEVLQESAIALLDSGQLRFASASSLTLSSPVHAHFPRRFQAKPSSRWQP